MTRYMTATGRRRKKSARCSLVCLILLNKVGKLHAPWSLYHAGGGGGGGLFLMLRSGLASRMHTIYARKKRRVSGLQNPRSVTQVLNLLQKQSALRQPRQEGIQPHGRCCIFAITVSSRKQWIDSGNTCNKVCWYQSYQRSSQTLCIYMYIYSSWGYSKHRNVQTVYGSKSTFSL